MYWFALFACVTSKDNRTKAEVDVGLRMNGLVPCHLVRVQVQDMIIVWNVCHQLALFVTSAGMVCVLCVFLKNGN